jgi:glycosyltransferase involved in cell wall biosynthesis
MISGRDERTETARMPRLLFLAHSFPPKNTIGCVRTYSMAKWLTRRGWEVTVVTPRESAWGQRDGAMDFHRRLLREGIRCIRTEHHWQSLLAAADRRSLLGWIAGGVARRSAPFLGIEREAGWVGDVERACAGLTGDDVDLVLASGPPFVSFELARRLAERLGCPYVLDYRDLWTKNPHAFKAASKRLLARERRAVEGSAAALGVSPSLVQSVQRGFAGSKPMHVISNGYDPEELEGVPRHDFGHFAIVYTGTLYPPKRGVEPLMAALLRLEVLKPEDDDWTFHYYGSQGDYVRRVAESFGIAHRTRMHGTVPRPEALAAVRGANLAVVISSVYEEATLEEKGIVTGKVFEEIGLRTPLLVIAPAGSDLDGILAATGLGKRFAGTEIDAMAAFLLERMRGGAPKPRDTDVYSWETIGRQLDDVLRGALFRKEAGDAGARRRPPARSLPRPQGSVVERAASGKEA